MKVIAHYQNGTVEEIVFEEDAEPDTASEAIQLAKDVLVGKICDVKSWEVQESFL